MYLLPPPFRLHGFSDGSKAPLSGKLPRHTFSTSTGLAGWSGAGIQPRMAVCLWEVLRVTIGAAAKAFVRGQILPHPRAGYAPSLSAAPVVVAGMFQTANGLGRAAHGCVAALEQEGFAPLAVDTSALLNQVNTASGVPLSELDPGASGTLILFANPPEIEQCLLQLGLRRWHNWRIIGAWAWETPVAPAEWKRQTAFVSEIWAPSRFVADAFRQAYDKPVRTVPHFVEAASVPDTTRVRTDGPVHILTFADAHSSLARKNPVAAALMFRKAFPEGAGARLTLKCRNLEHFPGCAAALNAACGDDPRIRLVNDTLTHEEQAALLASCDILLSPHRSEGFGLPLAEAMAAGKCVMATGWSGNLEFMSEDCAAMLAYTLVPLVDPSGIYSSVPGAVWADPDIEAGAGALRRLAAAPEERARLGRNARAAITGRLKSSIYREALQTAGPR